MPLAILTNPESPRASAQDLLDGSGLPGSLRKGIIGPLARYLREQPECRHRVEKPEEDASEVSRRAFASGEPVERFRRVKAVSGKVSRALRDVNLARKYAQTHANEQVRQAASKVLRCVNGTRAEWQQIDDACKAMRSAVWVAGRSRARSEPVGRARTFAAASGKEWRRVTTPERLEAIGREARLCTAPSHPQSKDYVRALKRRELEFYELVGPTRILLGLISISINAHGRTVSEARGPGNEPLAGHRNSVKKLLRNTGTAAGDCPDLLAIGLADGFLDIKLEQPDWERAGVCLWRGSDGAVLVEHGGAWNVYRAAGADGEGIFIGYGGLDADNLLGTMFNALLTEEGA